MSNCKLCGTKDNLVSHHMLPISCGGTDDESNIVTLCKNCHSKVHTKILNENIRFEGRRRSLSTPSILIFYGDATPKINLELSLRYITEILIGKDDPLLKETLETADENRRLRNIILKIKETLPNKEFENYRLEVA